MASLAIFAQAEYIVIYNYVRALAYRPRLLLRGVNMP
jgi:hypothetical protein